MTYTVNGTDIIESATEANFANIPAVVAVTAQGTERTLNFGNYTLNVNGTLTYDPDFEHLIWDANNTRAHDIVVSGGGILNIGKATTSGGYTRYSNGNAAISQRVIPNFGGGTYQLLSGSSTIFVGTSGTLNYLGGYTRINHTLFVTSNGKFNMSGGTIELVGSVRRLGLFGTGAVNFTGGTLIGVQLLISVFPTTFSGVTLIDFRGATVESSNNRSLTNVMSGLTLLGSTVDLAPWFASYLEFRSTNKGSGVVVGGLTSTTNPSYAGIVNITQSVQATVKTQAGTPIASGVLFMRDTDNGKRNAGYATFDYTQDNVYIKPLNISGQTDVFIVQLAEVIKQDYTVVKQLDIRGKTGVAGDDLFDFYLHAYGYQARALPNTKLQSNLTVPISETMLTDTYVTLSEANAVAKLASSFIVDAGTNTITVTENSSLDDLYDSLKVFKTRPVQAQLEYPSIGVQPVAASGSVASTAMAITVNSGVALSAGTKLQSATAGTVTAALSSGGAYTYSGGTITAPTTNPTLSGGTLDIGDAGTYVFGLSAGIVEMTPTAAGTYVMTGCAFTGTIDLRNTSAFPITVKVPNVAVINTDNNTGGAIALDRSVSVVIAAPNLLSGSRVRLYNVTDSVEIYNGVLLDNGLSVSYQWRSNKTIEMTATYCVGNVAKHGLSSTGVLTSAGLTFLDSQNNDPVYLAYGLDGSAVTGFDADYVNTEVNLVTGSDFLASQMYAWWVFNTTSEMGIRNFFGGILADDLANLRIDTSVVNLYLDNSTAIFVNQMDSIRIYRTDGLRPARDETSGGGGIDVNWMVNVYVAGVDLTSLAKETTVQSIKSNTDLIPAIKNDTALISALL
jgi:hypothetical protein